MVRTEPSLSCDGCSRAQQDGLERARQKVRTGRPESRDRDVRKEAGLLGACKGYPDLRVVLHNEPLVGTATSPAMARLLQPERCA